MSLTKARLRGLLPHAGSMCLLDAVRAWDATHVVCEALSHRDPANPLRRDGRLSAVCGVEYAAQAMAVHKALCDAGGAVRQGFLGAVRELVLEVERLDDRDAPLEIEAHCEMAGHGAAVYRFVVAAAGATLVRGRVSVVFPEDAR